MQIDKDDRFKWYELEFAEDLLYINFFIVWIGYPKDESEIFDIVEFMIELVDSSNLDSFLLRLKPERLELIKESVDYIDDFLKENIDFIEKIMSDNFLIEQQKTLYVNDRNPIAKNLENTTFKLEILPIFFILFSPYLFLILFLFKKTAFIFLYFSAILLIWIFYKFYQKILLKKIANFDLTHSHLISSKISEPRSLLLKFYNWKFKLSFQQSLNNVIAGKNRIIQDKLNKEKIENIKKMDPYDFEFFIAQIFEYYWFKSKTTKKSWDDGIDIMLWKWVELMAVQCKRQKWNVWTPSIRNFIGSMQFANIKKWFFVTTGNFSLETMKMLRHANYELFLIDVGTIERLIAHKNKWWEIDKFNSIIEEWFSDIKDYTQVNRDSREEGKQKYKYLRKYNKYKKGS